jgi:hypothetical protein
MRDYDLFPFLLMSQLLSPFPFLQPEKRLLDASLNRLDVSMDREVGARVKILEAFGVNFEQSPHKVFQRSRNLNLGVFVPAPIKRWTSNHVMVTDAQYHREPAASHLRLTGALTGFARQLKNKHGFILPNLGLPNVRLAPDGKISLAQFASLTQADSADITLTGQLIASNVLGSDRNFMRAARGLDISITHARSALAAGSKFAILRLLVNRNPELVVAGSELIAALATHTAATYRDVDRRTKPTIGIVADVLRSLK